MSYTCSSRIERTNLRGMQQVEMCLHLKFINNADIQLHRLEEIIAVHSSVHLGILMTKLHKPNFLDI